MKISELNKRLKELGFSLFGAEESRDINSVLAEVVKSNDLRLWEGFPVMLADSAEKGLFDYDSVEKDLKKLFDRSSLRELTGMSLALYRVLGMNFSWEGQYIGLLGEEGKKEVSRCLDSLNRNEDFKIGFHNMSPGRVKSTFSKCFIPRRRDLKELLSAKEESELEYSLDRVFSAKQKELFLKKLRGDELTKTEKEYFSRTVRKKVIALANPELHRLSQKLLK